MRNEEFGMRNEEALTFATKQFIHYGFESARLEAEILLANVLNVDRIYLYVHSDYILTDSQIKMYKNFIQRRLSHEPTAYIIGHREFMGLEFTVNKDVLIPRPDTEILVETVIERLKDMKDTIEIVDVGTGSGAIAISLAKYLPNAHINAIDISEAAINIAKINSQINKVSDRITFHVDDWENFFLLPAQSPSLQKNFLYNAIVSNPPYILSNVIDTLEPEVAKYEPRLALDGGDDGLDFYRRLIDESPKFLSDGGFLAVEIGYNQAQSVKELATKRFKYVEVIKDLSQNDRVVVAKL